MPEIADETIEDIGLLLTDCEREFRQQSETEQAKMTGPVSMVEARDAKLHAERYGELADACARYRDQIKTESLTEVTTRD